MCVVFRENNGGRISSPTVVLFEKDLTTDWSPRSEDQLECELDLSSREGEPGNCPTLRQIRGLIGKPEVRRVEEVEELAAELQPDLLGQCEVLIESPVKVDQAGASQDVSSRVSEGEHIGQGEGRLIEPTVDAPLFARKIAVANAIWPQGSTVSGVGAVRGDER